MKLISKYVLTDVLKKEISEEGITFPVGTSLDTVCTEIIKVRYSQMKNGESVTDAEIPKDLKIAVLTELVAKYMPSEVKKESDGLERKIDELTDYIKEHVPKIENDNAATKVGMDVIGQVLTKIQNILGDKK